MNDIDEFLLATLGLYFGITVLMLVLTYLERTLSEPARAPNRSVSGPQRTEDSVHLIGAASGQDVEPMI